ncbi:MAG TPA: rhodanese-like domain-containing protein, partial [Deltaproteobacteria bacterium]|nr:rhodanese-like domain-containing protein [Deltaproteobacteria bacterium]
VLLQCRSGVRSAHAAAALVARGFTDVTNLEGGILAWTEAYR